MTSGIELLCPITQQTLAGTFEDFVRDFRRGLFGDHARIGGAQTQADRSDGEVRLFRERLGGQFCARELRRDDRFDVCITKNAGKFLGSRSALLG